MCKYIETLRKITPHLSDVPELDTFTDGKKNSDGMVEYKFKSGSSMSLSLYNEPDGAIAKTYIPRGLEFEKHLHRFSYEILIVLQGKLKIITDKETLTLKKFDKYELKQGEAHSAKALVNTKIIVITIPSAEGFPV